MFSSKSTAATSPHHWLTLPATSSSSRLTNFRSKICRKRCRLACVTQSGKEEYVKNAEGLDLLTRTWSAATGGETKGAVVLVHGFSWHSGYFQEFAEALSQAGYAVSTFDLQGHGRSESALGIRGYAQSFESHVNDVQQLITAAKAQHQGLPIFAFGESMGGLVLLLFSLRATAKTLLAGLVLSAPVIAVADSVLPPKPVLAIMRFLARFFPRLPLSTEIKDGHLTAFGNQEIAVASLEDPLVLFDPPTLGFLDNVMISTDIVSASLSDISLTFLVLHGQQDSRTDWSNSVRLHEVASSPAKTIKLYPNAKHQLLQDQPEITGAVISDIVAWLDAQIAAL